MLICKNNTDKVQTIRIDALDSVVIQPGGFTDLMVGRSHKKISGSVDLAESIIAKKIVVNNGTSDLHYLEALDLVRYQQSELPLDDDGNIRSSILKTRPFNDAGGFRTRLKGVKGLVTQSSPIIDLLLTEERWINGVQLLLSGHKTGDSVELAVMDVQGHYSGKLYPAHIPAPVPLDKFAETFYVSEDKQDQGQVISNYPARLLPGMTIRLVYNHSGEHEVQAYLNLFMHIKAPAV
jgi:hypothetical protein